MIKFLLVFDDKNFRSQILLFALIADSREDWHGGMKGNSIVEHVMQVEKK